MRQVTQNAINAMNAKGKFGQSNTTVTYGDISGCDISHMYLFGNLIAIKDHTNDILYISMAGWGSVTTRERLNGFNDLSIYQRKGDQYLAVNYDFDNAILLDPCKWYSIDTQRNVKELRTAPFFAKQ